MARKVYVGVTVHFDEAGNARPLHIEWEDRVYEVDRVTDVRRAASLKVGGCGTRYTCRICGQITYLFEDEQRWYVEAK
ncbi:hypothetical protein LJC74_06065 [Eubacteriales bacterium OttesenSCG-928-A19]|nr:hypothetical protein [Eubacteriales bacterium OttesenSCG-928-A19]